MLMPSKKPRLVLLSAIVAGLTACGSMQSIDDSISVTRSSAAKAIETQNRMKETGAVTRMPGAKIAGAEVLLSDTGKLPSVFLRRFNYLTAPQTLKEILGEIGRRTGISTAMQPDSMLSGQANSLMTSQLNGRFSLEWKGDLKGLLDHLAAKSDMYWKYEEDRIYFYKTDTRSFHIYLPGGKRTVKSSISLAGVRGEASADATSGSGGGSASGVGTVDVSSGIDIDAYDAILKSVQVMVSNAEGGAPPQAIGSGQSAGSGAAMQGSMASKNVVANPSLGIITVTATPIVLDRVSTYIRGINERFAQNVMIAVKLYNVTVSKDINAGLSLTLAYQSLANKYGIALTGSPNLAPSAGTPGSLVLNSLQGSNFAGSSIVLQALEQLGDVSLMTSGQVIAVNGQPSPLQVATELSYLSSSATTQTANVGQTTTLTPATKTVGFTANFLPLILGDNRIMLQYQINLSSLLSLDQITSNSSMIQTPTISTQSLQQQAIVKDGQSIVLFGFEQEKATANRARGLTGVSNNGGAERNMMVIVMEVYGGK
jgi:hypothetical protein